MVGRADRARPRPADARRTVGAVAECGDLRRALRHGEPAGRDPDAASDQERPNTTKKADGDHRPARARTATLSDVYDYDLLVLGSGPSGQKAAIAASKLGRRVGIVDRRDMIGGVCINTGTVPSKTLREAVLYLTGLSQRDLYGSNYRVKDEITVSDLAARTQHAIARQT